ncbi:MAG: hypothetical protein A2735_02270 [Candidatus Yanofskybacteria bacterium RIFCSPHIGHO2_01_FULL_41_21]|uniref:Uncharacterized protein n=1 Tax=Candidatus Yanofskybacteria bacterium RIFCSPHIGHO2_01_FULL_41_21 TaxID=1802660 RepID=A0A1F8EB46_9BACT|nr:MAG: hypothetical protein A2735_02270 [Candidatus Yanofskybacteria bacterium RIFCSPHIGHO2_01_FULL_41_21]
MAKHYSVNIPEKVWRPVIAIVVVAFFILRHKRGFTPFSSSWSLDIAIALSSLLVFYLLRRLFR